MQINSVCLQIIDTVYMLGIQEASHGPSRNQFMQEVPSATLTVLTDQGINPHFWKVSLGYRPRYCCPRGYL